MGLSVKFPWANRFHSWHIQIPLWDKPLVMACIINYLKLNTGILKKLVIYVVLIKCIFIICAFKKSFIILEVKKVPEITYH